MNRPINDNLQKRCCFVRILRLGQVANEAFGLIR